MADDARAQRSICSSSGTYRQPSIPTAVGLAPLAEALRQAGQQRQNADALRQIAIRSGISARLVLGSPTYLAEIPKERSTQNPKDGREGGEDHPNAANSGF